MSEPDDRFDGPPHSDPPKSEAVFNAPLSVVVVALSMPVLFFFQRQLPDMGASMAFAPIDLQNGRWGGLFTAMLLHGGWAHALMNAVGALAFGAGEIHRDDAAQRLQRRRVGRCARRTGRHD